MYTEVFLKEASQTSKRYSIKIPLWIRLVIQLMSSFREVRTIAVIIKPRKTLEPASPLVLNVSINALKEPVTKVTRQKMMSRM